MKPTGDSGELMYVKCSYCGEWLDVKPGGMNLISHSICPKCFHELTGKLPPAPHKTGEKKTKKPD